MAAGRAAVCPAAERLAFRLLRQSARAPDGGGGCASQASSSLLTSRGVAKGCENDERPDLLCTFLPLLYHVSQLSALALAMACLESLRAVYINRRSDRCHRQRKSAAPSCVRIPKTRTHADPGRLGT